MEFVIQIVALHTWDWTDSIFFLPFQKFTPLCITRNHYVVFWLPATTPSTTTILILDGSRVWDMVTCVLSLCQFVGPSLTCHLGCYGRNHWQLLSSSRWCWMKVLSSKENLNEVVASDKNIINIDKYQCSAIFGRGRLID